MKISSRDGCQSCGHRKAYLRAICPCHWDRQITTLTTLKKKSLPSMQSFLYICEYLGVTPQEFFDEGNPAPQALKEFIAEAKKLDSRSMGYILGIMKELNSKR